MNDHDRDTMTYVEPSNPELPPMPDTVPAVPSGASGPARTRAGRANEIFARWISAGPRGEAFGRWLSRTIALPQLRRLAGGAIPWAPLRRPVREATVALITTGGVHLASDRPFHLNGDATFRVIPQGVRPADLAISHQAYWSTLRSVVLGFLGRGFFHATRAVPAERTTDRGAKRE